MNDDKFLAILNSITREHRLKLPVLPRDKPPSGDSLTAWATCLEQCIKQGITLSDPRWQRVTIADTKNYTTFALEAGSNEIDDGEFRIGLQLLMSVLGDFKNDKKT
jgi:hypothetical protein